MDANQAHISLTVSGFSADLQVLKFDGSEALNELYEFDIELVSEKPDLDLNGLINQPAYLSFGPEQKGIHGVVYAAEQGDSGKRLTRYRISLRPQLAYLAHCSDQRIFQHMTVQQIISDVLNKHGIQADAYRFQLGPYVYPERDYCVQYNETDLHFIQRLCEEEGISFHFQHSASGHVLVFGDEQTVFQKLPPLQYQPDSGMAADGAVIKSLLVTLETRSSAASYRDYNFEKPKLTLDGEYQAEFLPALEVYEYPGRFAERPRGKHLAKRALERLRSRYEVAAGRSDASLVSGSFLSMTNHPRAQYNDLWLIHSVVHQGRQPQVLEESVSGDVKAEDGFTQGYRNSFVATPWDIPFRPALKHRKGKVQGAQRAVVTGPKGEEIYCDEYGRVKVKFFWDRVGQADEQTSCWLRVSNSWAGNSYGAVTIPRIGMEVLVSFFEGDPDQPIVSGCLYHKENAVPYALPENKTCSTFKTNSSLGGAGFNELRIEDKAGQEQIFVHAQRDWDQRVEHDEKIRVGNERHDTVEANSYSDFKAEEHRMTHLDRKTAVDASDHLNVAVTQHAKIGVGQFVEAGTEIHYYAGSKVVIDAGMELTAKGGGSFVKVDPSGITFSGATIKVNSGGAAGVGSGIALLLPKIGKPADQAMPGELPMALTARQVGASRCPICEACAGGVCETGVAS
ncbi:type VI secretion system tip protein VgrG [Pseudomonas sp. M30-35]|uniref:type VI secretion system Vgr family protein n=1 Tax=Pseudomonas sp. M30-35 TaxID=1981174 RepID=UPI000B3CCE87|nr:type VI secretion system tip protein VgrG [Pseudomonas sp. M30-35]ARU87396.1 type IV secretion protein Rhs [Pseudomonas sp. M30-35]